MNTVMVTEPALCLHKQEEKATEVGTAEHKEENYLKEVHYQGDMKTYTGTLSAFHATVMENLAINAQINNQKQLILK